MKKCQARLKKWLKPAELQAIVLDRETTLLIFLKLLHLFRPHGLLGEGLRGQTEPEGDRGEQEETLQEEQSSRHRVEILKHSIVKV